MLLISLFLTSLLSADRANVDFLGQVTPDEFSTLSASGLGVWGFSDPQGLLDDYRAAHPDVTAAVVRSAVASGEADVGLAAVGREAFEMTDLG